jgi:hypothetical protein
MSVVTLYIVFYYADPSRRDASDESDSGFVASDESKSVSPFKFKFKDFKAKVRSYPNIL